MGDTKEIQLHHGVKFARIVTATLAGLFFFILLAQTFFFPNIQIDFQTGTDAQQIASISIKKGSNVELPIPLKPGSCFLGWSLSPDGEILTDSTGLMKNTTLYAVWDGAEKYAVLSVNGMTFKEVNIFDTRIDGLTPDELNANWRVLDDYAEDNTNRIPHSISGSQYVMVDPNNNFTRFLGWQYLNSYGRYNELRYEANDDGIAGEWYLIERDADGNETYSDITETNKFYPPNYRTTFTALLEYRTLEVQFYHQGDSTSYKSIAVDLGDELKLPAYENPKNLYAEFSHWELQVGDIKKDYVDDAQKTELAGLLEKIQRRYQAGEVITTIDPLWYYLGTELISGDGSSKLVVMIEFHAVHWDNVTVPQYTIQPYTDLNSGTEYIDVADVGYGDLSFENPVSFDGGCIWFSDDNRILSYTFYDHDGVYHEIKTIDLKDEDAGGIMIGGEVEFIGQSIYFNPDYAINIVVNYQTSAENVVVKFNYGTNLYLLPNYRYSEKAEVVQYIRKIGNSFVFLTGEKYLKTDHIFTGWRMVGDASEHLYCAGESFTIPNFDSSSGSAVIEFEAVWHLQRLLFNFDFVGGRWENENGPDFTLMKGAFGDRVQVVKDIPVRFGYDFIGWSLDTKTYEDESDLLQPGDVINVGAKMQMLYAQWKPQRLRVLFYGKEIDNSWRQKNRINNDFYTDEQLRAGGYVELPLIKNTTWSTFNGWIIGDEVVSAGEPLQVTTAVLAQLETRKTEDSKGAILEVRIYADETKNTVELTYDFDVPVSDNQIVTINIDHSQLKNVLVQGDRFFDYYPFSADYKALDTNGRQFNGWSYEINGKGERYEINSTTIVPEGVKKITIYGDFDEVKNFQVQYYDFNGVFFANGSSNNFGGIVSLIDNEHIESLPYDPQWGSFVGWALEQDRVAGNPELIYEADASKNPQLKLSNQDDTSSTPYLINIDRYADQLGGNQYVLKLYAVYSVDFAKLTYIYLQDDGEKDTNLILPVYSNGNYDKTVSGGSTVGYNSADFLDYGNVVLDDKTLTVYDGMNFIGWQATLPDGVDSATKADFEDKIWFPGEFLPAIDFDITFTPIRLDYDAKVQLVKLGTKTYRVLSLSSGTAKIENHDNVDVVAFPRGSYTIKTENVTITSDSEVHVVLPSNPASQIIVEPRAIQCNTIKEFYVGENLTVTGSPVVGAEFQAYRVQKGYRVVGDEKAPTDIIAPSVKYDYESCMKGLLVCHDRKTLYGVPSHVQLTADELFDYLSVLGVDHINGYALSDINSLPVINLGFNLTDDQTLTIDNCAIYNGSAKHIILPSYNGNVQNMIDAGVIAGSLPKLSAVTFGNDSVTNTGYAFVDEGFVYYVDNLTQPNDKTHVMYVLPSAKLESLEFTVRNLRIADTVSMIEPCALMGRDWEQINSIMLENNQIDVRNLANTIEKNIPIFVSAQNVYKAFYNDPRIQSYKKVFEFTCTNSDSAYTQKQIEYSYGETFTVFSAQDNNYDFNFDRTWYKFIGWKINGYTTPLSVGEVYKVGMSDKIKGDKYTVRFDASSLECWKNYPVQFYVYDGENNVPYIPEVFYDSRNNAYQLNQLLDYERYLGQIYLPGVEQSFVAGDGSHYAFIGWGTSQTDPGNLNTLLWNKAKAEKRVLPNKTLNTGLNVGNPNDNIYRYYALYEKVTPNMQYELLANNTYAVSGFNQANVTSLNIPFAKYYNGYMVPVSKINDRVFEGITSGTSTLTEIAIGGAVTEIGQSAFSGVNAKQINFAHSGREIRYNHQDTSIGKLTIGQEAFARNQSIQKLVLPSALETLRDRAFQLCTSLTNVTFESNSPSLSYLGNFVFRDNQNMTNNEVIRFLSEDNEYIKRFTKVGDGIFMNTGIRNLFTSDGRPTNKIVWRGKLLHVFYLNQAGFTNLTFDEKEIGGYAFVNAGNNQDSSIKITLSFTNANAIIHANAFTNLHASVNIIHLKQDNRTSVKIENVNLDAFDNTIKHTVTVYTNNQITWTDKFKDVANLGYVQFR